MHTLKVFIDHWYIPSSSLGFCWIQSFQEYSKIVVLETEMSIEHWSMNQQWYDFYTKYLLQVHHGQPGGDVHGAADAVQQDVRDGPRAPHGRARRRPVPAQPQIRPAPVSGFPSRFSLYPNIFSLFSVILCVTFICHPNYSWELLLDSIVPSRRGRVKIGAKIAQFSLFSLPFISPALTARA